MEKIKIAFDNYDSDSSGFIDRKEFKALLYELVFATKQEHKRCKSALELTEAR